MKLLLFFLMFLFLLIMIPVYILFMPQPIEEGNCEVMEISPDKGYKVITCSANYKILSTRNLYSLKIYNERTGELVYKDVFYFMEASKFYWGCQGNICQTFFYLDGKGGVTVSLPPNYWHRLRAKIPLWSGE